MGEAALPQVKLSLAGEKPFAKYALGALQCPALGEVLLVCYQNIPNEVWMVEEIDPFVAKLEEDYIAVLFGRFDEEWQPSAGKFNHHVAGKSPARSRGQGIFPEGPGV